jgi:hypothetical protein
MGLVLRKPLQKHWVAQTMSRTYKRSKQKKSVGLCLSSQADQAHPKKGGNQCPSPEIRTGGQNGYYT